MKFFSIRTNDQETIKQILSNEVRIIIPRLSWHKDEVSLNDIVFIVISGDTSKKKIDYINGLRAIGKVISKPIQEEDPKYFSLDIEILELFPESITKDDFYNYPELKNAANIGPETKQAPNQAFRFVEYNQGLAILTAIQDHGIKSTTAEEYLEENFSIKKLHIKSETENIKNKLIETFVSWFYQPENYIKSYDGLVNYDYLNFIDQTFFKGEIFKMNNNPVEDQIQKKYDLISSKSNDEFNKFNFATSRGIPSAILGKKNFLRFLSDKFGNKQLNIINIIESKSDKFDLGKFDENIKAGRLSFSNNSKLTSRFVASLLTKPFVILTGLAGSGKTKMAQSFIQWISEDASQYKIVPVGADWINREPLLGYPDGLKPDEYVTPDNGVLELMMEAAKPENQHKPYFILLDEMNLSHVERYFADFLSVMESDDSIKLYTGNDRQSIPQTISWPENLFIIGTVNIDETTYMFSPKVLDRANVIEFRLDDTDLDSFLQNPQKVNLNQLVSKGASMGSNFVKLANTTNTQPDTNLNDTLVAFFKALKPIGAEFGYRSAFEIHLLYTQLGVIDGTLSAEDKTDFAIMQKLLPKLHGSRSKIVKPLEALMKLCLKDTKDFSLDKLKDVAEENIKYKVSFEKLKRMYENALSNGFTSYAEA